MELIRSKLLHNPNVMNHVVADTTTLSTREPGDAVRAALTLIADSAQSRQTLESVNAELRDSERRFRQMIDALPAAIYTTDAKGGITRSEEHRSDLQARG